MFNIRQKQSKESIVLQKYAELIKNAENILFTKGVQYVNVRCNGTIFDSGCKGTTNFVN